MARLPIWFVYMLRGADGSLYTGTTTDPLRRYREHASDNKKGSKWARSHRPVELVYSARIGRRSAAYKEEARIKALPRAEKLKLLSESETRKGE